MPIGDYFLCTSCGGAFENTWSDEEAEKASKEQFGDIPEDEKVVVCEDCYYKLLEQAKKGTKH